MKALNQEIRIPKDRIPVLIGKGGEAKRKLEELGHSKITVNSATGDVLIENNEDAILAMTTFEAVRAIGRGFSLERSVMLFNDQIQLAVISLREFAKPKSHRLHEIKSRIIGRNGRTREIIEELTETRLCVYGDTVSIIGELMPIQYAIQAVEMLINGRKHRTVYQFLEKSTREIKTIKLKESFDGVP